jgi:hypothetical protein
MPFWPCLALGLCCSETIQWSEPENLSNSPTKSHQYILQSLRLHLFWVGWEAKLKPREGTPGNTIFYRRWDGQGWSFPVDIFFSRGLTFSYPTAAVDDAGNMYLIWMAFNGLHFSTVRAEQAGNAKNWIDHQVIAPFQGTRATMIASGDGEIDILYPTTYNAVDYSKDEYLPYSFI